MNIKRILSTALVVVMLFTAIVAAIPFGAYAAYSDSSASSATKVPDGYTEADYDMKVLTNYLNDYLSYNYTSASDMLNNELEKGVLYYVNSTGDRYSLFINKYTGFVYYVNNLTGQILTSNPINPSSISASKEVLMSQIFIQYIEVLNQSDGVKDFNSFTEASMRDQITVTPISGGLRVNYTLGDAMARFLLPGMVEAKEFEETLLVPMIKLLEEYAIEFCADANVDFNFSFFDNELYDARDTFGYINTITSLRTYLNDIKTVIDSTRKAYITAIENIRDQIVNSETATPEEIEVIIAETTELIADVTARAKYITDFRAKLMSFSGAYSLQNPDKYDVTNPEHYNPKYTGDPNSNEKSKPLNYMYETYPITKEGVAVYVYVGGSSNSNKNSYANTIKSYCPSYNYSIMYEQEAFCGYKDSSLQKPVFRCALEYTFNEDGSLSVCLPANSITYDETAYTLRCIVPLQYFGAGDVLNDGYVFYPDGSGTVVEFNDLDAKNDSVEIKSTIYGNDYAYISKIDDIDGNLHRAQVTMPVFGIVNETEASEATKLLYGKKTVTNGYFAILEEGAAMASTLQVEKKPGNYYLGAYATYSPYAYDEFDNSGTLTTGSASTYTLTSTVRYTGSYKTRYVMLSDADIGETIYGKDSYYESSYSGMAAYYRNYLKDNGTLEALDIENSALPLYIEVLGAMDITSRFLTFPVTKTIPLTTFANVSQIYEDLSNSITYAKEQAEKYEKMADGEDDAILKYQYEKQAESYRNLEGKIKNIKNINFKLTGFANGGMKSTYPAKLEWVKACGGSKGFKNLINDTQSVKAGENFSIYPEFDFQYINYTAMFDGLDEDKAAALLIDNRYASKQVYNSVMQGYESFFTFLMSPGSLDYYYSKFQKSYSKYDVQNISVSTLGSNLNSNFDEKNTINRQEALALVQNVLGNMNTDGYDLMIDTGNIYAVKYANHILNMPIDSSHLRIASYTVPFTGMVLHSYVNYTGEPINYSGSPAYDRLRAIESGAALYYIVCYQNTAYMKDDEDLSKYYGVNYQNWFTSIAENYKILDDIIGGLQDYEIVDHKVLISERDASDYEMKTRYLAVYNEFISLLENMIIETVDSKLAELKCNSENYSARLKLVLDEAAIIELLSDIIGQSINELETPLFKGEKSFREMISDVVNKYVSTYKGAAEQENTVVVNFTLTKEEILLQLLDDQLTALYELNMTAIDSARQEINLVFDRAAVLSRFAKILGISYADVDARLGASVDEIAAKFVANDAYKADYNVEYSSFVYPTDVYRTDSYASDENYVYTNFTLDDGNVTMVTYKKGDSTVRFILNYNNFDVTVTLRDGEVYHLGAYGYQPIFN